jgi:hypothetical protein
MVQTINMKADGSFEVNFGNSAINGTTSDEFLPAPFLARMKAIQDTIKEAGVSELHIEKDTFRTFAHTRKGADIEPHEFGTYVSEEEFASIMAQEASVSD